MSNYVQIKPKHRRFRGYNVSISDKVIRFSSSLSQKFGLAEMYVTVWFDDISNKLLFNLSSTKSTNSFKLNNGECRESYSFYASDVISLFREYISHDVSTAKFEVTFESDNSFYIEFNNWKDVTRHRVNSPKVQRVNYSENKKPSNTGGM